MEPLYSPSWYRVEELRPRVSARARFHRHEYRGETWHVVRSPTGGQVHRVSPEAYALVGLMDGERTTGEIWKIAVDQLGDDVPTQDETIRVLGLLFLADLLRCDLPPDTAALFERTRERESQERRSKLNPVSIKVPLFDPDPFLTRFNPWARHLFSRAAGVVWCAVMGVAAVSALKHAPELAAGAKSLNEPASLLALWFAYPLVKGVHELGHAFGVKRWGGAVHEMGILFLVFIPMPYVDASGSSVFPEKHRRMIVAAAGIAVELFLAAIALFVWLAAEPGLIRHIAYAVMLVGGVSTVFFNGNPLLRYDGYYVLADALEIPKLSARGNEYVAALAKRWLLGLRQTPLPETAPGEVPWLVSYALAAYVYRTMITFAIALYLAGRFFAAGVALALVTVARSIVLPLVKGCSYVLSDPVVGQNRGRAVLGSGGLVAAFLILLFVVPLPLHTRSEGVVWLPEKANVRSGTEGFVVAALAEPNTLVARGQPLLRIRHAAIEAQVQVLRAKNRELEMRVQSLTGTDRVQTEIVRESLAEAEAELARAQEHADEVVVRSPLAGRFVMAQGEELMGRFVEQGQVVAHVVDLSSAVARVVVPHQDVGPVREGVTAAWVRLAHDLGTVLPVSIARQVPAATDSLPTRALGTAGGGRLAVDASDPDGLRTLEPVFQFDLSLPPGADLRGVGERVYVRFDHGAEPVGQRAYRALRRVFLRQLGV